MNHGEGDMASRRMESLGHERTFSFDDADLVILNTCTVVETTEKRMMKRMNELRACGKEVIVTGCMAKVQRNRISIRLPGATIIPPEEYDRFSEIVEGRFGVGGSKTVTPYGHTAIVPIAQGCLGNCSYCITRLARGTLISRPADDLISEFEGLVESGVKEILIAAQDVACYGKDTGIGLPALIERFLRIDGDYRIRLGMMSPNHLAPILEDMIVHLKDPRVYKFVHIPVQSGSDAVLNNMRRHYTVEGFVRIVKRLREEIPGISIATDVICGFPGETDKDHGMTMDLVKELRADTVNITRYSPRPGTDSVNMDGQVGMKVSRQRSQELTDLKYEVEFDVNSNLVGKRVPILVTESDKDGIMIGRTDNYRPVVFRTMQPMGSFTTVEITSCAPTYLMGKECP